MKKWISTTGERPFAENSLPDTQNVDELLSLTGKSLQTVEGFGGAFNELEWIALSRLEKEKREEILKALFDQDNGCKFSFCRIPVGANDYAADWYSCNENAGDYEMACFSIARDKKYLIPFIKAAMCYAPGLRCFASPWSPPTWMKTPPVYNNGTLNMDEKTLRAYALYFEKFIQAYGQEGIKINRLHIQNEPFADQKFPSCVLTGEQYRVFIRDYLGPLFERDGIDTEIFFGTLNGPALDWNYMPLFMSRPQDYDQYVDTVLFDKEARRYIKGIGYQWNGKQAIQRTHESFPELTLMQTESECGDGKNSWAYARYMFRLMHHYFSNGVQAYVYWNMALNENGTSTWGWNQNAMITIDSKSGEVSYNPEFYLMKHFSAFVLPGAKRLETAGHWTGSALVFENPDGEIVVIAANGLERSRDFSFEGKGGRFTAELAPLSFNTFIL